MKNKDNYYSKPKNGHITPRGKRKINCLEVGIGAAAIALVGVGMTIFPLQPVTSYYSQEGTPMERLAAVYSPYNEVSAKERALVFSFTGKTDLSSLTKNDWKKVFDNCP
jgi:hypothetical protein